MTLSRRDELPLSGMGGSNLSPSRSCVEVLDRLEDGRCSEREPSGAGYVIVRRIAMELDLFEDGGALYEA